MKRIRPRRTSRVERPVKGLSGPKTDKIWREAIMLAVKENGPDGKKKLRKLAQKLVGLGIAGDVGAIREIGDRIDGKPKQETEIAGKNGGEIKLTTEVIFVSAKPKG